MPDAVLPRTTYLMPRTQGARESTTTHAYAQQAFSTGWTRHSHSLTENFLRAANAVALAPLQHTPTPTPERLEQLEHMLGHLFTHRSLLLLALTHPSACAQGSPNSKVLSWMGDSALHLAVTEQLASSNIDSVGKLTEARARLVSRENCCRCAKYFGLDKDIMIFGKGVLVNNGGPTDDMLGEAMEAVFGAVYVDGGMEAVRKAYGRNFPLEGR